MKKSLNIMGFIPARKGSKGVPRKNVRNLLGKPVISYTIEAALAANLLDHIVISTDDPYAMEISQQYDVTLIERPHKLATCEARIDDAMRHCCIEMEKKHQYTPDIIVLLYANIPVRAFGIVDRTIQKLIDTEADSVQTMSPIGKFHPYWLYKLDNDKASVYIKNNSYRRQELPPVYAIDGAVAAVTKKSLFANNNSSDPHDFWGNDRRGLKQEAHETVDIDSLRDFLLAEATLREIALRTQKPETLTVRM